jgi:hypothetical protein
MMCCVADVNASDGASGANQQGVLANLPRTRPQRSSARRAAARDSARAAPRKRAGDGAKRATGETQRPAAARTPPRTRPQKAPRQGFESEGEATSGSVQPPGATELVASAAEIVGELAKAGLSKSERLVKDLLSRLPH